MPETASRGSQPQTIQRWDEIKPQLDDHLISKNKFSLEVTQLDGNFIVTDVNKNTQITLQNISLNTALNVQLELFS